MDDAERDLVGRLNDFGHVDAYQAATAITSLRAALPEEKGEK